MGQDWNVEKCRFKWGQNWEIKQLYGDIGINIEFREINESSVYSLFIGGENQNNDCQEIRLGIERYARFSLNSDRCEILTINFGKKEDMIRGA